MSREIAFSGNSQDGGMVGTNAAGFVVITSDSRAKYNALVATYGRRFSPPLARDDGVVSTPSNCFLIDKEHWEKSLTMNWWRKQGQ